MKCPNLLFLSAALAPFAAFPPAAFADVPAPGYSVASAPNPAFAAPLATLPGGDFVTFDGQSIDRWTDQGAFVQTIGSLAASTFPSFAVAAPGGQAVVVGESTNHFVFVVPTNGSGPTPLAQLAFNYDAAFSPSGELFVSAAAGGFGLGNDVYRVAIPSGALQLVAHVNGPSGPITFDASGALYYATQGSGFPAPAGSSDILRWDAAQVAAGALTELDATLVCAGLDGAASLAVDPATQTLYVAETSFLFGTNFVRQVGATQASSPIVIDAGDLAILGMHFVPGATAATFAPYQPDTGVRLVYGATDYFSASQRSVASPRRPQLSLSGPGLSGPGTVTLTVTGGVPGGSAYLLHCAQTAVLPTEVQVQFPTFLLHTPFVLSQTRRMPFYVPADASGTSVFQIYNPGGMQGTRAYQFLVGSPSGVFLGSSNAASF